jgi:uncharacterized integral membrane protein
MNVTLFIIGVTLLTLYGLTVSGHFPFEARKNELRTFMGTLVISATILSSGVAAIILIVVAVHLLPWTAIVIGGGGAVLAVPLLLRVFPDDFVDGIAGLLTFAAAAIVAALLLLAYS